MTPSLVMLGIDPGQNTGLARFVDGELKGLRTIQPFELERVLRAAAPAVVVFEDSRMQSHVWAGGGARAALAKIARNVGEIDAWCKLIEALAADLGYKAIGVSPTAKGAKTSAKAFETATGFTGSTNQHERDAAMVAWPYRRARL